MKVKEVERFEGLVAGEGGFVNRKLCGATRNTHVMQWQEKWRSG
jgi:hypothetical protein